MNKNKLRNIKVLVWDVDGTLYQSIPELWLMMRKRQYQLLSQVKKISFTEAEELLMKKKKINKSATKSLVKLGCRDIADTAKKIDIEGKHGLIRKDLMLLEMFKKLKKFRHLVLTNRAYKGAFEVLRALGIADLKWRVFERIYSAPEEFGAVKPDSVVFEKILEYTGLLANQHLMIGDRAEVDLVPAKKLGMKTCLVWGQSNDPSVDVSIGKVYDIVKILL